MRCAGVNIGKYSLNFFCAHLTFAITTESHCLYPACHLHNKLCCLAGHFHLCERSIASLSKTYQLESAGR